MKQYLVLILSFLFLILKLFRNCNRIFHYEKLTFLLVTVCFYQSAFSENFPGKFSVNLKLSAPLLKSDVPQFKLYLAPGIEALYYFSLFRGARLGTGLGFEKGHQIWNSDHTGVTWIDGKPQKYSNLYVYHFDYLSAEVPVSLKIPLNFRLIRALNFGVDFGWYWNIKYSMGNTFSPKKPNLNRFYMSNQVGTQIPLFKFKGQQFNIHPFGKYRYYLTEENEYQGNYFFIGINLNTNF